MRSLEIRMVKNGYEEILRPHKFSFSEMTAAVNEFPTQNQTQPNPSNECGMYLSNLHN